MSATEPLDLGPLPERRPRPRLTARPRAARVAPSVAEPTILVPSGSWVRPTINVRARILNDPGEGDVPTTPALASQSHEKPPNPPLVAHGAHCAKDCTARAALAVLVAYGPGTVVVETTAGIRERCAVLAERVDSSGHS